ncbi:MAG TPA: FAD-dependent oxidoreductase [Rhizomicrobium sp.]|jgi:glycine oxidase|nr:FAD-dependent oxidoreductase [Rhizomicrobium sp.]
MKVIVIGAGAAGLAIGWRLAQQGAETVVIERGQPGQGATRAAAGMIAAPAEAETELARRGAELWPSFAGEIERASGRTISWGVTGGLVVAKSPDELNALAARARSRSGDLLTPDEARRIEPRLAPEIAGALWIANESKVDNRALGPALAAAFVKAGGSLLVNETVVRFDLRDNKIQCVQTPFALYQSDAYVLAAGAWTSRIRGLPADVLPPIVPVKGEMLAFDAPAGEKLPGPGLFGNDIYMIAQRGRLCVGATAERVGFDSSLTDAASSWLLDRGASLIPALRRWPVAEHWAGLRPGSPDDQPILGASALDGLYIAGGQFRSGILYTPAIAEALTALVLGNRVPFDFAAFTPRRFARNGA